MKLLVELAQLDAAIEPGDKPDFVLHIGARRVGVEHREMYDEDVARNIDLLTRLQVALDDAAARLGVAGEFSVAVGLNLAARFPQQQRRIPQLAANIAAHAWRIGGAVVAGSPRLIERSELAQSGMSQIEFLRIQKLTAPRDAPQIYLEPGFCDAGQMAVLGAVLEKERLLPTYRSGSLDEVWLLLVTGETWTQTATLSSIGSLPINSKFERVYFLDAGGRAFRRLDQPQR